jgi:hypothetical protein
LISPCLKIGLGSLRQKPGPGGSKIGAGSLERLGGSVLVFARVGSRVEAALPSPGILIVRDAAAERDGADVHIAVIDVPAFLSGFVVAAAGESGHALLKRGRCLQATTLGINRRISNGDQVNRVAALALKRGKSVDFTGYWQRRNL